MPAEPSPHNEENPYQSPQASSKDEADVPAAARFPRNATQAVVWQVAAPTVFLVVMVVLNRDYASDLIDHPILLIMMTAWGGFGIALTLGACALASSTGSKLVKSIGVLIATFFTLGSMMYVVLGPAVMRIMNTLGSASN
ncbi:MAG: hypothetical protein N2C14_22265 [Planctomycetales bacterium]